MTQLSKHTLQTLSEIARANGIVYLALFGSYARNEANAESDVDLIAHFQNPSTLSLFHLLDIQQQMEDELNAPVQLLTEEEIHPYIRDRVDTDRLVVYTDEGRAYVHA